MKKGDRVAFSVVTVALPREATGLLLKKDEYANGAIWKVLVCQLGRTTTRRIREQQLRVIR